MPTQEQNEIIRIVTKLKEEWAHWDRGQCEMTSMMVQYPFCECHYCLIDKLAQMARRSQELKSALNYLYHQRINALGQKVHETLSEEMRIEIGKLLEEGQ